MDFGAAEAQALARLLSAAIEEDLGPDGLDVTTAASLGSLAAPIGTWVFAARQPGVICGLAALDAIAQAFGGLLSVALLTRDGQPVEAGQSVAQWRGPADLALRAERTALNLIGRLSGIATLTRRYVDTLAGTGCAVYDTRKTTPGLRVLEKYAVRCGGGVNHRMGLHDALLLKDNHLAMASESVQRQGLTAWVAGVVERARALNPSLAFVEAEADRLDQVEALLGAPVDVILLDNMPPGVMRNAVALRNRLAPKVQLESSGGLNLETVRAAAEAGVDRVAIGALTHSAVVLDVGLDDASDHASDDAPDSAPDSPPG
ncbi:MAG: carboxylating nicotinate-nucleotide diphosphorylase [Planctomycetota bacterium]